MGDFTLKSENLKHRIFINRSFKYGKTIFLVVKDGDKMSVTKCKKRKNCLFLVYNYKRKKYQSNKLIQVTMLLQLHVNKSLNTSAFQSLPVRVLHASPNPTEAQQISLLRDWAFQRVILCLARNTCTVLAHLS